MERDSLWLIIGFTGQAFFFSRFFIQWLASERRQESVIPTAFWYLSIAGGVLLLSYALFRRDPVFIAGQAFGVLVYSRNLWFLRQKQEA